MKLGGGGVPKWVIAIVLALVSIEPATHVWIAGSDTAEAVATGLHTTDSSIYLSAMEMLGNGFYSPYATCKAPGGANDIAFLPAPFHWLYALVGVVGASLSIDAFLFLGIANALGGAVYLFAVYFFLRAVAARYANAAFVLFALSGGLGGVLFLVSRWLGWQDTPQFDLYFVRFSMYELVEGPYLSPVLHMPRLYYTASLACCFGALTALVNGLRAGCPRHALFAAFLLFCGALINVRFGGLTLAIGFMYLWCAGEGSVRERKQSALLLLAGVVLAGIAFAGMSFASPTYMRNTEVLVRETMWLPPFLSVALFQLLIVPRLIRRHANCAAPRIRTALYAGLGYLAAYFVLYTGHQIYFGNFWIAGDSHAAQYLSDWALVGAAGGALYGYRRGAAVGMEDDAGATVWISLWVIVFVALAVSGFGQGWYMRFTPQRLMIFLGVPLSILAAQALDGLRATRPRLAAGAWTALIGCGVVSIGVGALYFQGPFGRAPGEGPLAGLHVERMTRAEAGLIERMDGGIVLAPWAFSDVIALRPETRVLGGIGSTDLSDQMSVEIQPRVAAFFSLGMKPEARRSFLEEWCIEYVYCPDTWPLDGAVVDAIRGTPGLKIVGEASGAALFRFAPGGN